MKKLILLIIPILLLCGCTVSIGYEKYKYKDLEGNVGEAKDCWMGQGLLICELDDGTRITVQSYRGVNYES